MNCLDVLVTCLAAGQLSELLLRLVPSLSSTTSAIAPPMAQCEAFSVLCEGLRWEMNQRKGQALMFKGPMAHE